MNNSPSFDTWTTIFLFAAVQGLFVSAVIFFIKKEDKARYLLAALTLLFSVTLIEYVLWWTRYLYQLPHFFNISASFPLLYGPLLYYYFRIVFEKYKFRYIDLLALLPFLLNFGDFADLYFSSAEYKRLIYSGKIRPAPHHFRLWHWVRIVHMIIYLVLILKHFSGTSKTQHEVKLWFRYLTGLYTCFIASYASYYILVLVPGFNVKWDYMISFSMMFTIYFLSWFGYLQPNVFKGFSIVESIDKNLRPQKYKNSPLTEETSTEIANRLHLMMSAKKLYRQSDLRLDSLAEITGIGKHHLSQVINEKIGMTFFEYLNSLRIKEAEELLKEKPREELNIIEIAYHVGFNNKVSFNNTFKKITGMTPTEYRKTHRDFVENAMRNN
jgi:AraC-like DNA-binding protein